MSQTAMSQQDADEMPAILIVEDEQDLLELLRYNLARDGYEVHTATTGEDALEVARREPINLILLDLMLPTMDGLEVCRRLKSRKQTAALPIIMLTARGEEADVVRGLEAGADDYITKPFSPRILLARMQAVLRRAEHEREHIPGAAGPAATIRVGEVSIDPERHEVMVAGQSVSLTAAEFRLLTLLAGRPGRVFTRQQIIDAIHDGMAAVTERSVDVLIVSLRRKLGEAGHRIDTVRGVGYRFKE